jgi:hypothetical protein
MSRIDPKRSVLTVRFAGERLGTEVHLFRVILFETPLNAIETRNAIRPYSAALAR